MKLIRISFLFLLLAGCGSLIGPSEPPAQIYLLEPRFDPPDAAPVPARWQLAVARPDMPHALDTDRIVLVHGDSMDYYANAQWQDTTGRLLQALLVEAFEKSGTVSGVGRDTGDIRADYSLETDVRAFDAVYRDQSSPPEAEVTISARLVAADRSVVATITASHRTAARENTVPSVVSAFDDATKACLDEIVGWAARAPHPGGS